MSESWHQPVGISLAVMSGCLIGSSLVLQKKGLIQTTEAREQQNEHAYLKSPLWWTGMACLALGEVFNFVAYAFSPAVLVTPLGSISVVVSAVLSVIFLKETISFSGGAGMVLCVIGSTIIVLHAPATTPTETIPAFFRNVFSPGFIAYAIIMAVLLLYLITIAGPRYGKINPTVYVSMTSICGAFLVNASQGFGSSLLYTLSHLDDNQFIYWGIYPLIVFICVAIVFQIHYLNRALSFFSTSIVTPLNYVFFSTATLITTAVLNQGFNVNSTIDAVTVILGFSVIVIGVSLIFQYNLKLNKLAQTLQEGMVPSLHDVDPSPEQEQDPISLFQESFMYPPNRSMSLRSQIPLDPRELDGGSVESIHRTYPLDKKARHPANQQTQTSPLLEAKTEEETENKIEN
ncbi:magnesium transporter NIPA-domain-containing protein [Gorgonomyces haynaldii]|nr:magnesium transporter NIPA-domain-containing protein [Gorgonomyces haynaldii]